MLVISAVVVAVVGSSYVFVPRFQEGVNILGGNVRHVLGTGSFAGLGLSNATVHDAAVNESTIIEGGNDAGNNGRSQQVSAALSGLPFLSGMARGIEQGIQQSQLTAQAMNGGTPPTGIDGNVCGLWAMSYIMNELGIDGGDLQGLMAQAKDSGGVLMSDDYRIDRIGMWLLADDMGLTTRKTSGRNFNESKSWLDGEVDKGSKPAVLVSKNGQPHWMVVTGLQKDDTGRVVGYRFQDSTTDTEQTMSSQEFQREWAAQGNVGIAFDPSSAPATASK